MFSGLILLPPCAPVKGILSGAGCKSLMDLCALIQQNPGDQNQKDILRTSAGNFSITAHCPSMISPIDTGIFSAASVQTHPQLLSWSSGDDASKKAKGKNATGRLCPLSCLTGAPGQNHSVASARSHAPFPDGRKRSFRWKWRTCYQSPREEVSEGAACFACGPSLHPWLLDSSNILLCESSLANMSCLQNLCLVWLLVHQGTER